MQKICLITGLPNHPSILSMLVVDEETFANRMIGMQRLHYCCPFAHQKTAQAFRALTSTPGSGFGNAEIFFHSYMNKE